MPILDRDGVEIFYEVNGNLMEKAPLLLTHGYCATSAMWRPNIDALIAKRTVITWDIRGHGRSSSPLESSRYSEELSIGDMAAILDELCVKKAVVGGLSLGGYLSLAFYLHHPEKVVALMLFDTGPGFKKNDARAQWNRMAEETAIGFENKGLEALPDRPEVRISKHYSAQGLARAARGILSQRDSRVIESLPEISVPTLIVVGELDTPFLAASDYMAKKVPNAIKVVIEGAGHASNIDKPETFNRAVLDFLEECE